MLDAVKLTTLRAVIAHGSFSAAATAVGLTQPAVSRQVSSLERTTGVQLVRRTQQGVHPTEAGRVLMAHAEAILDRMQRAEADLADLAGLRAGGARLGSFLTALAILSPQVGAELERCHPRLFEGRRQVIDDVLVDRAGAFRALAAGELDVAIVFEHEFEDGPTPPDVEVVDLFDDPPSVLLARDHHLATAASVSAGQLAGETWLRAHDGTAARLVDDVLRREALRPAIRHVGHGDEPIETQAFVAAGHGVTVAHDLNILITPDRVVAVPLAGGRPVRRVQAAVMRGYRAPVALAVLEALTSIGARRGAGRAPR